MQHRTRVPLILVVLAVTAAAALGRPEDVAADVPDTIPIQGRLVGMDDVPLDGDHTLHFTLYDAADTVIFSETQVVTLDDGDFTAYLGEIQSLDVSLIDGDLTLGLAVDDDMEMTPRIPLGSVPFAMHTPELPPGMVSYFDLSECPTGWSRLAQAEGRAIVGATEDGTLQGTVGEAFGDLEDREHAHVVDPGPVDTSSAGSHTHDTAAQPNLNTSSDTVAHTHGIPSLGGTTNSNVHNHRYLNDSEPNAFDADGAWLPVGLVSPGPWNGATTTPNSNGPDLYTENDSHNHTVTTNANNTGAATSTSHDHSVTVPAQTTSSAGSHVHPVDIPSVSSGASSTSSTMPYVQLTVCRKD
jgi:hypothetical protein